MLRLYDLTFVSSSADKLFGSGRLLRAALNNLQALLFSFEAATLLPDQLRGTRLLDTQLLQPGILRQLINQLLCSLANLFGAVM